MMKRKGLFGAIPMPGIISGYGGGTWNMDGTQATPADRGGFEVPTNGGPSLPEAAPTPKKGGGFFGEGGFGRYLAGSIGDVLMQANGFEPTFAPTMALRRQMELQQQRAQQQRQAEWDDWVKKQEYEAAHPRPVNNDTINDFNWFKTLSPQDRALYGQMKPQYITADNGDGTKTIIPVTPGMFGGQPSIPTAPVGKLKPLGGTAGNSGGGFR